MKVEFFERLKQKQTSAYFTRAKDIAFDILKQGSGCGLNSMPSNFINEIHKVDPECNFTPQALMALAYEDWIVPASEARIYFTLGHLGRENPCVTSGPMGKPDDVLPGKTIMTVVFNADNKLRPGPQSIGTQAHLLMVFAGVMKQIVIRERTCPGSIATCQEVFDNEPLLYGETR
jgi:hypothetical protein